MIDRIGNLVKDVGYSLELLRSKLMQGQITPQEAELARMRIERYQKEAQAKPVQGGTVVDQGVRKLLAHGQPQQPIMAPQMPAQEEEVAMAYGGLAELPVNMFDEANYAGGGIVAFSGEEGSYVDSGISNSDMYDVSPYLPKEGQANKFYKYKILGPDLAPYKEMLSEVESKPRTMEGVAKANRALEAEYGIKNLAAAPEMQERIKRREADIESRAKYGEASALMNAAKALLTKPRFSEAVGEAGTAYATGMAETQERKAASKDALDDYAFKLTALDQQFRVGMLNNDRALMDKTVAERNNILGKMADLKNVTRGEINKAVASAAKENAETAREIAKETIKAKADKTNLFGTVNSAVYNGLQTITNAKRELDTRYPQEVVTTISNNLDKYGVKDSATGAYKPKAGLSEAAKDIFNRDYERFKEYNSLRAQIKNIEKVYSGYTKFLGDKAGVPENLLDFYGTNQPAPMANPSKNTISGDVDYSNKFLRKSKN